jgi:HEAT repeat protein
LLLVCLAAPTAFGQLPAPSAEDALRQAEDLVAKGELKAATVVYEKLIQPEQPAFVRRGALGALLRLDQLGAEARIIKILHSVDSTLKPVAIAAVGDLRSPETSKKLGDELPRLQPEEQVWLIDALAGRGDADARSAIRTAVAAADSSVRLAAIAAVGSLEDASAVPLLSNALTNTKDATERRKIELALANLKGGSETDQAIIKQLRVSSADSERSLISALTRRSSRVAVPALLEATGNTNSPVVRAAFEALSKLAGPEDLPALLDKLVNLDKPNARSDAENAAAQTIFKVEDTSHRSLAVCTALGRTTEIEARRSLISLLPICGDAKAFAVLRTACGGANPRVRDAAVRALVEWPDAIAWEALVGVYRRPADPAYRLLALRALVRLAGDANPHPTAALIDRYRQLFAGTQTDGDRKLILSALAGAAHPDALQLAVPLLTNNEVRAEAALAVKKIAEAIKDQHPQAAQAALEKLK